MCLIVLTSNVTRLHKFVFIYCVCVCVSVSVVIMQMKRCELRGFSSHTDGHAKKKAGGRREHKANRQLGHADRFMWLYSPVSLTCYSHLKNILYMESIVVWICLSELKKAFLVSL